MPNFGYQLKAGQSAKSGSCADCRNLFIAGLLSNLEISKPKLLSRLKLVARILESGNKYVSINDNLNWTHNE
ncbi:MAG: hypothetical protein D3916_10775 [Candidatus Electrothrix sp. MAN1_4]|nr:hypothetical protein [Candidatus Electrothrix sp. MAN1_4]